MNHMRRVIALLLFLLLLVMPCLAMADGEKSEASAASDNTRTTNAKDEKTENNPAHMNAVAEENLRKQIEETYAAAKKRSRRKSFKGYCGAYVANQLVVLGINTTYLSANGKNTYDIYKNMDYTSGGYRVSAFSAKEYSLSEALRAIVGQDPAACNILVGFQKGTSTAGKKYGHVLFIHGIRNGKVFYSDSSSRTVEDIQYKEGEPIVCSLAAFADQYAGYKLDGVILFQKDTPETQPPITEETILVNSENVSAEG